MGGWGVWKRKLMLNLAKVEVEVKTELGKSWDIFEGGYSPTPFGPASVLLPKNHPPHDFYTPFLLLK